VDIPAPKRYEPSRNLYRIPYADGTLVKVVKDTVSHDPGGRIDMTGVGGSAPYRVVAADRGQVMLIEDTNTVHSEPSCPPSAACLETDHPRRVAGDAERAQISVIHSKIGIAPPSHRGPVRDGARPAARVGRSPDAEVRTRPARRHGVVRSTSQLMPHLIGDRPGVVSYAGCAATAASRASSSPRAPSVSMSIARSRSAISQRVSPSAATSLSRASRSRFLRSKSSRRSRSERGTR
jgi:hypothetical protein